MGIDAAIGAQRKGPSKLTAKQRRFAEELALGNSKAGAYRAAYDSHSAPVIQSQEGYRLSRHPEVSATVEALRLAAEARRHATPAALRSLVIERLTAHAIDDGIQPAQRLRALELLGKVTEVAAFTERREVITQRDPAAARAALLDNLRAALRDGAITVERDVSPVLPDPGRPDVPDDSPGDDAVMHTGDAVPERAGDAPGDAPDAGDAMPEHAGPGGQIGQDGEGDPHPPERERDAPPVHMLSNPPVQSPSVSVTPVTLSDFPQLKQ